MHVISRKRLNEFAAVHPNALPGLDHWYRHIKREDSSTFADLRKVFPNADHVGGLTVFNIGGNKARLIAAIHYNRRKVYIRAILTHDEYDQERWKKNQPSPVYS